MKRNGNPERGRVIRHADSFQFLWAHGIRPGAVHYLVPFFTAVVTGDLTVVEELLESGKDVEVKDSNGKTALYLAAELGNIDMVKFLLEHGAKVNAEVVRLLCLKGFIIPEVEKELGPNVRPETYIDRRSTPLLISAERGHSRIFEILWKHFIKEVAFNPQNYERPFLLAAEKGNDKILQLLWEFGNESGELINFNFGKALRFAAENGHYNVVKLSLKHGIRDLIKGECRNNFTDDTALCIAAARGHFKIVEAFLKHHLSLGPIDPTSLHAAAENGRDKVVNLLLKYGIEVDNRKFRTNETALFVACRRGHLKTVEALLKHDASLTATDYPDGKTAFHVAVEHGHNDVVKLLLKHGADANIKDGRDKTSFQISIESGHSEIVQSFLENGSALDESLNPGGLTPLHLAAQCGHFETVKLLLERGAVVNSKSANGNTPLMFSAEWGHADIVDILLESGASIDSANSNGETALELAAGNGHDDVVGLLLEKGADSNSKTKNGVPLLLISAEKGYLQVVEVLLKFGAVIDLNCLTTDKHLTETLWKWEPRIFETVIEWGSANGSILSEDSVCRLFEILRSIDRCKLKRLYDDYVDGMIEVLQKYTMKILGVSLFDVENSPVLPFVTRVTTTLFYYVFRCVPEIESMKKEKVGITSISFYDILTNDLQQLSLGDKRKSIIEFLESVDFEKKFPLYSNILKSKFQKSKIICM